MPRDFYTRRRVRSEQRLEKLRKLGFTSYSEYLDSPFWRAKKAHYRASNRPQECICGADKCLQIHHMTYENVGNEQLEDLTPLCPPCHAMIHALEARGEITLDPHDLTDSERAFVYGLERRRRAAAIFDPITEEVWLERLEDHSRKEFKRFMRTLEDTVIGWIHEGRDVDDVFRWLNDLLEAELDPTNVKPPEVAR